MTREGIVSFQMDDYVDDVKDVMARRRFRDFPILDEAGKFLGFISRRRLLNSRRKQVILVDHNAKKIRQWTVWKKQRFWKSSITTV